MVGPLRVSRSVVVPEGELRWRFSRSSGPGGQSVNTADSRVELPVSQDLSSPAPIVGGADGAYPFYVPFGASSLSSLGFVNSALWPSIRMLNRADSVPGNGSGNQNACKNAVVHLSFVGTP